MAELQDFQKLVIANASPLKGMKEGDKAPDFVLPNAIGKTVGSVASSLKGT